MVLRERVDECGARQYFGFVTCSLASGPCVWRRTELAGAGQNDLAEMKDNEMGGKNLFPTTRSFSSLMVNSADSEVSLL